MSTPIRRVTALAALAGGTVVWGVRSAMGSKGPQAAGADSPASGWLVVTVFRDPADIDPGALPAPLAEFDDRIEIRVRPAADGKGTELAARLRDQPDGSAAGRLSGKDPQADLRSALRRAKQLIEVGEVLAVDPIPHGERTASPGGALIESMTKAAPKAGVR